ncbi:MAG: hypothetical protein K9M57_04415 [Phycisphaerae bacterium]|nr:hypothetical protein [Phycisphaerae bacterium]
MKNYLILSLSLAVGLLFPVISEQQLYGNEAQLTAVQSDWLMQDSDDNLEDHNKYDLSSEQLKEMIEGVLSEVGVKGGPLAEQVNTASDKSRLLDLYFQACQIRRVGRLEKLRAKYPKIVFTKHHDLGGSHYAYTEAQSDAQHEMNFKPDSMLCLLELDEQCRPVITELIDSPKGVIRDPDVSYDGKRILFAWKKSQKEDDYHLYEYDLSSQGIRQLTRGVGFADYEGVYLPNGDILFNSSRCVQTVDCWWTEVSNLYTCDKDGRYLRRLSFDQVHTNYPTVTSDGRVIYTRWDYNDRGQIYPQPLFQMNPDGTGQTECYGNNSWFPTTIMHARDIPGTGKLIAILSGHHSDQKGKLAIIEPSNGRQENQGVQLIAPVRETRADHIDAYGQEGFQYQYPYPVTESEFIVTVSPNKKNRGRQASRFSLYWLADDGRRELLAFDSSLSCNQPVPLSARPRPQQRASMVDYAQKTGTYYMDDIYVGPGLEGVPRGSIKSLRVIALDFRAAGVGSNGNRGAAGGALVSTPISINNGSWDVKIVLGDAHVYEDGSACFTVPAQTPVYFQAIDSNGHVAQTMRSWSTLQPGEKFSCVGCHESKNDAPIRSQSRTMAMKAGAQLIKPFYGPPRGFSYVKEIQPIWDKHCIQCHTGGKQPATGLPEGKKPPFSLLANENLDNRAKRKWSDSYLALTQKGKSNKVVNWHDIQSAPPMLKPYTAGAAKSKLITMLKEGHGKNKLSQEEFDKIACWIDLLVPYCGDYTEANAWSEKEKAKYTHFLDKRKKMQAIERQNILELTKK